MAMANLIFVPNATTKSGSVSMGLEDVPEDVRKEIEEVYQTLKTNPGRMQVSFDTIAELNTYIAQVQAYCANRPAGAIRFRKSPARGLPKTTMQFRITDLLTDREAETEGIREAADAVAQTAKSAAKK